MLKQEIEEFKESLDTPLNRKMRISQLRLLIIGISCLSVHLSTPSLAQVSFERTYGNIPSSGGNSVQQTTDGGYIIAGDIGDFAGGLFSVYLIRTDSLGDTLWTKTYGGFGDDEGNSIQQTSDGGFIIAGRTRSFGSGLYDVYLIRTDSSGDAIWARTYGGNNVDEGFSVQETMDGGFIVAGGTWSFGAGEGDVYLIRTDPNGDTLWTRTYGGSLWDYGYSVQETQDSGYVVTGITASFGGGWYDVYLIRTDTNGDTLWTRAYGGTEWDYGYSVQVTHDNGFVIGGRTTSFGAGNNDVYLVKTDSTGDTLWTKTFGGTDFDIGKSVRVTQDSGYVITGITSSFGPGFYDVYLVRTDASGNAIWTRTFGGGSDDGGESIQETQDGGFIIAGFTASFRKGLLVHQWGDVYLIKTDSNGQVVGLEEESNIEYRTRNIEFRLFQNQPNPFKKLTAISFELRAPSHATLQIYNISGRLVETLVDEMKSSGVHQVIWEGKGQASGIYFYRLTIEGVGSGSPKILTKKLTLLR
jgi:hypothetical protein